jgi:hypothetical protein
MLSDGIYHFLWWLYFFCVCNVFHLRAWQLSAPCMRGHPSPSLPINTRTKIYPLVSLNPYHEASILPTPPIVTYPYIAINVILTQDDDASVLVVLAEALVRGAVKPVLWLGLESQDSQYDDADMRMVPTEAWLNYCYGYV